MTRNKILKWRQTFVNKFNGSDDRIIKKDAIEMMEICDLAMAFLEAYGPELKPCPHCGGEADPEGWDDGHGNKGPECYICGSTSPSIDLWNKRV